jgi:hypothetical protein
MATGANATINLNAVDNTRAAFLGVQRNLQGVQQTLRLNEQGIAMVARRFVGMAAVAGVVAASFRDVWREAENIKGLDPMVAGTIIQMRNAAKEGNVLTRALREMWANTIWGISEAKNQLSDLMDVMRGRITMEDANERAIQRGRDAQRALEEERAKAFEPIQRQIEAELTAGRRLLMSRREIRDEYIAEVEAASERAAAHRAEGREMEALIATLEAYRASNAATREELAMQREEALALARAEEERTRAAREAAKMLSEGFEDAVFSGKKLSDVVKQLTLDLMRMAFRSMITAPLGNALGGFFGGLSLFGGARAMGGPVSSGKSYLVGERGPEIFTPSSAGNVISNEKTMAGGKGGSTYYIDARGADQTGLARLEAMIRQTQAAIVPMALGAMQDARARGGAFAV